MGYGQGSPLQVLRETTKPGGGTLGRLATRMVTHITKKHSKSEHHLPPKGGAKKTVKMGGLTSTLRKRRPRREDEGNSSLSGRSTRVKTNRPRRNKKENNLGSRGEPSKKNATWVKKKGGTDQL